MVTKKKKPRLSILKKRAKKIDNIAYRKLDIMWFWRWLKLAVDMEGQSLDFGKFTNWNDAKSLTTRKGRYDEKQKVVEIRKRVVQKNTKKIVLGGGCLSSLNLKELKRLPKVINMTEKEKLDHSEKWFYDNKHLFADYTVHYAETNRDMIESNDYITMQIPKSLDRRKIDNQVDLLMTGLKLKNPSGKKRDITFVRGVQRDVMKKQWEVFKLKTIDKLENSRIAKKVGYQTGEMLEIKGGKKQTQGVRAVQKSYVGAKCMIFNIAKGIFPKSSIE